MYPDSVWVCFASARTNGTRSSLEYREALGRAANVMLEEGNATDAEAYLLWEFRKILAASGPLDKVSIASWTANTANTDLVISWQHMRAHTKTLCLRSCCAV